MRPFTVLPELRVGRVVEVAGDAIRIEIDADLTELTRTHAGDVYPVGQFGSVLKLHAGRQVLFAYVRLLRMRSEIAIAEGKPIPNPDNDSRIIEANLFAEGRWSTQKQSLDLARGVTTYPLPGQIAYLTTLDELTSLYSGTAEKNSPSKYRIHLGNYVGANGSVCYADLDKLFGLHCAVLGSTGAGKSGTVAAILHALLETNALTPDAGEKRTLRPRVVLIDPHGEYAKAFGNRCRVFRAFSNVADAESDNELLRLPYWLMSGEEFRDLVVGKTEWEATSENNIVLKALRHSRLAQRSLIEKSRTDWLNDGVKLESGMPDDDRPINKDKSTLVAIAEYNRDTPDPFSLLELRNHIQEEQGIERDAKGNLKAISPSGMKSHTSILDKLAVLERDPRLAFMMKEYSSGDPDLAEILQQFVGDVPSPQAGQSADIRIIDISGLPNEVAGPLTAAIARLLFQYKVWQTRSERERDPVLLVFEEAHRYVPDTGLAEYVSAQKAIRRLAKEGANTGLE